MAAKKNVVEKVLDLSGEFVMKQGGTWGHADWESYLKKAAELQKLCQKKEGRIQAAERIADLAARPDKSMIAVPEPREDDPRIVRIDNGSGATLETITSKNAATKTTK